jgi:hypothetical protein
VDSFSFGILMWEMYTGQRAYSGLGRSAIISHVTKQAGRPVFPPSTPHPYMDLAVRCWDTNPDRRPGFVEIISRLQALLQEINSFTHEDLAAAAAARDLEPGNRGGGGGGGGGNGGGGGGGGQGAPAGPGGGMDTVPGRGGE